MIEELTN